jgi:hypothetical protein
VVIQGITSASDAAMWRELPRERAHRREEGQGSLMAQPRGLLWSIPWRLLFGVRRGRGKEGTGLVLARGTARVQGCVGRVLVVVYHWTTEMCV